MKKHTSIAGPTGLSRIRSLVTFRHQNPAARLASTVAAAAIAILLVAGTGAAYADDTPSPDPAATDTAAPAADPTAAPSDTPTDTFSDAPAATDASAPPSGNGTDTKTSTTETVNTDAQAGDALASTGPSMSTTLKTLASGPTSSLDPCLGAPVIGGFEIDGDECTGGPLDWDSVDTTSNRYALRNDKFVDDGDTTGFQGSSKALTDPLTWSKGPAPNDKSDIATVRVYSQKSGVPEDTFSDFAINRHPDDGGAGGTGTVTYDVEYNQLPDVLSNDKTLTVPHRSPGDLWFVFDQHGNISLDYIAGYKFYATDQGGCKAVDGGGYWCLLPAAPTFGGATSADGSFAEGTLDISDAFDQGVCFTFGVVNVRTRTSNTDTTAFKDYIAPLDAVTSNCGSLVITKKDVDTDAAVGGGVYQIIGDPRPDGAGAGIAGYKLCIYDGTDAGLTALQADPDVADLLAADCDEVIADGTADGTITIDPVLAGSYKVTEIVPPPGYLLNPGNGNIDDPVVVVDGEPASAPFANHKQWQPLAVTKTADGTFKATYLWGINKQIAPSAAGPWSDATTPGAPLTKTVDAGGNTSLYYQVVVTEKGIDKTAYTVTGSIHVDNPNDAAVDATIDESLTGCSIDGGGDPVSVSVPAGGASYPYTCDLGDNLGVVPDSNTATVTWDKSTYPQTTDDINAGGDFSDSDTVNDLVFTEIESNDKTVTVGDDHFDIPSPVTHTAPWTITYGEGDGSYESGVYSNDTATSPGTCSAVITNTATVNAVEVLIGRALAAAVQPLAQDSESGRVCVNPVPLPPVVAAPEVSPPAVLPNTGGPDVRLLGAGLLLLLGGGTLVMGDRRRRRRS